MKPQIVLTAVGVVLLLIILGANECNKPPELGGPLRGLSDDEREQFDRGKALFGRTFVPGDGLGPLFNATSCAECHESPVQGGVGDEIELHISKSLPDGSCDPLLELGGPVLQGESSPLLEAHGITGETVPIALVPAHRTSPHVFGFGLLDAIPDAELRALADPDDADGDGVSGRLAVLADGTIGRFGRKAAVSSLENFTEIALLQEQGITSPAFPDELLPNGQALPAGVDPVEVPELNGADTEAVFAYVRFLAPPAPQRPEGNAYIFVSLGCAKCHVLTLKTKESEIDALNSKNVAAYTDLLLHDMGPELADICMGAATAREFRTAPLIGLHLSEQFLHDGRAKSIEAAILAHGGEANVARTAFTALVPEDKRALLKFLGGL